MAQADLAGSRQKVMVTVIVPCFNPPLEVFQQTLASVSHSSFRSHRLIIVDDGSTDARFLKELHEISEAEQPVTVLRHARNRGLAAARNTGVACCETPCFVQLDADDIIDATFIEKCLWHLESHRELSFCNSWVFGFGAKDYLWHGSFDRGPDFLLSNQSGSLAVIRRDRDRGVGGHDETIRRGNEDWDYWLKMAMNGCWGGTIPEYLFGYRHHALPSYWPNRDNPLRKAIFQIGLWRKYFALFEGGAFPMPVSAPPVLTHDVPFANTWSDAKPFRHLLMLGGGADFSNHCEPAANWLEAIASKGWAVTFCSHQRMDALRMKRLASENVQLFALPHFLHPEDYPRFLKYLMLSRQPKVVLDLGCEFAAAIIPYLQRQFPAVCYLRRFGGLENAPVAGGEFDAGRCDFHDTHDFFLVDSPGLERKLRDQRIDAARIRTIGLFPRAGDQAEAIDRFLMFLEEVSGDQIWPRRAEVSEERALAAARRAVKLAHDGQARFACTRRGGSAGYQAWRRSRNKNLANAVAILLKTLLRESFNQIRGTGIDG